MKADALSSIFRSYLQSAGRLQPLPLPESFQKKIQRLSSGHQISIALTLNILSLAIPIMMLQVYDRIIPHQSYGTLVMLLTGVLIALGLDATLRIIRAWLVGWSAASQEHGAGCAALDHVVRSDMPSFEKEGPGVHMQNFMALSRLRELYSGQTLTAMVDVPFAILFLGLVAYLGGWLVIVPAGLLVAFAFSARLVGMDLKKTLEARAAADDRKAGFVVGVLTGIHTIKAIGMEAPMMRNFEHYQKSITEDSYKVAMASSAATNLSAAFGQLSTILTATFGCLMVLNGSLSVGGLSACTLLAGRAIQPIQRVLGTWLRMQDLSISQEQAAAIFKIPANEHSTKTPFQDPEGRIVIDNIAFSYPGTDTALIDGISLAVEPGEVIALSGIKGSGKSTLLQLIAGIYYPTRGIVRVDDVNPAAHGLSRLAGRVGYLPQQGTIFRGTILDNLTGFRNGEDIVAQAKETAYQLGLNTIIDMLPRGYQTMLSDTTADPVPPGVKQRIALCRVLANKPAVLLYDDADRSLDKEGYNQLFRIIGRLKGRCTIIMISHDQNLLSFADDFYEIKQGKLIKSSPSSDQNISFLNPPKRET